MQDLNELIEEIKRQKDYYSKEKARLKAEMAKYPIGSILPKQRSKIFDHFLTKSPPKPDKLR